MESTSAYIITTITALVFLLLAAIIAKTIQFERGARPRDPQKRRAWFWILAVLNPVMSFLLGYFVFKPDANMLVVNRYITALTIGTGIGFVLYIAIGFIISRMLPNGKLGHWF